MGGGQFDDSVYSHQQTVRKQNNISDFAYSQSASSAHPTLDPLRINSKPAGILESRDSVEHPESTPIIVTFDITGSNIRNAEVVQKRLPELMAKLATVVSNPQLAIWANDDVKVQSQGAVQVSEFESDNRIDEAIRNTWLTGNGGGNGGESYDLLVYAAARKTSTDAFEKRGKKGYMFLYADEPFFEEVNKGEVEYVFGDTLEKSIPIGEMIQEAKQKWNIFLMWPKGGQTPARRQYVDLFGADFVFTVEGPNALIEQIVGIVNEYEDTASGSNEQEMSAEVGNDRQV